MCFAIAYDINKILEKIKSFVGAGGGVTRPNKCPSYITQRRPRT
jgi:hypothetical protein